MTEIRTHSQLRLVTLNDDGTVRTHHEMASVSGERDRAYYMSKWTRLMDQHPMLHLAIEERTVTQSFTEWDTVEDRPKQTLF